MPWSSFYFHSPLSPSSRGSLVPLHFCHKDGNICISEVIDILLETLIPFCSSSSLAFHMMYSAYKLSKQGDSLQSGCTPLPIWNQSVVPCPVLTVASGVKVDLCFLPLRNFQFSVIYTVKCFGVVNEAEVDVFPEFSNLFYAPTDVGNLIPGSSAILSVTFFLIIC